MNLPPEINLSILNYCNLNTLLKCRILNKWWYDNTQSLIINKCDSLITHEINYKKISILLYRDMVSEIRSYIILPTDVKDFIRSIKYIYSLFTNTIIKKKYLNIFHSQDFLIWFKKLCTFKLSHTEQLIIYKHKYNILLNLQFTSKSQNICIWTSYIKKIIINTSTYMKNLLLINLKNKIIDG